MTMAADETTASSGDSDGFSAANVAITTIVVLVLMAVLAVLGYKSMESDGVRLQVDPTTPASPGTALPSVPEQPEPASSLVGMTEAEVRELYARVRVVEEDGVPRPSTMDLQAGRINLSLRDGVVTSSFTEGCEDVTSATPAWVRQACSPDPDRDGADAVGKLLADGDSFTLEVGTTGDQEYQGMTVAVDPADTIVLDANGSPVAAEELRPDDVVSLWVAACAESSPVQCSIDVIVLDRVV